jgi:glycosyltransferase involved in cell wall biosynthesis
VPLLVRAYAAARERFERRAPLVIWGGFPGEWEGEHPHTVASELGVPDVFLSGWRGHDDLARGLPCCDVMVAPSHNEPFGQVFLEAMAAGVPVIASNLGALPELVGEEHCVPANDPHALAARMQKLWRDPGRRHRQGNAHIERALAVHSEERYVRGLRDVYVGARAG